MLKLYYGGPIYTMEKTNPTAEALVTADDKLVFVGASSEARSLFPNAEEIDLHGKTLLPAFIDAHSHFSSTAMSFLQISLRGCCSWTEIGRRIKAFLMTTPPSPGQWITAVGYDHNILAEKRHPSKAFLDRCCPDHPLALHHTSGHMGAFNSPALNAMGITAQTPVPKGGRIDFNTGYLEENAFVSAIKQIPMPDADQMADAYVRAQAYYASYGVTTIQEGMMVRELLPMYQALLARNALTLDVVLYCGLEDFHPICDALENRSSKLRMGGYKIFLDGSPQGRTAWMRKPYVGSDDCGYGTMTTEAVAQAIQTASAENRQILAHCNGDAAAAQFLEAVEKTGHIAALRPVLIHGQLLGLDQLPSVKALGILPSFFIAHIYHWGETHVQNFGLPRAETISPAGSANALGIPFTFHLDTPVLPPDMLETIWCAAVRQTKSGRTLGAEEKIDVQSALEAVTVNAAYQYFSEDRIGSLRPGKQADLVILDEDPFSVSAEAIRNIQVLKTIKDGKQIYQRAQDCSD